MSTPPSHIKRLPADKSGLTALEYGIIASILGVMLIAIFTSFGQTITALFSGVSTSV